MTPAEEITAAAKTVRGWTAEEPAAVWGPTDIAQFGPALADWLDATAARLQQHTHPGWQDMAEPHALTVARTINGGKP
ncbi:hypothetical protein [Streptomyces venezuelae]